MTLSPTINQRRGGGPDDTAAAGEEAIRPPMSKLSPYWWFVIAATLAFITEPVSGLVIVITGHIITGLLWLRRERTRPLIDQMPLVHTGWGRVVIVVFWMPAIILAALRKWQYLHSPTRFFLTIPAAEAGNDPSTF